MAMIWIRVSQMGVYTCSVDLDDPDADAIRDRMLFLINSLLLVEFAVRWPWRVNDALNTPPTLAGDKMEADLVVTSQ